MGEMYSPVARPNSAIERMNGRCLLITLEPVKLIVPRILVAEIIHSEGVTMSSSLSRNVRIFEWRGYQVPLLSPPVINPRCPDVSGEDVKFVIFHGLFNRAKLPYYAIPVSRNPRIIVVTDENISERVEPKPQPSDLLAVTVEEESAVIPRVDCLEQYIIENCYK